MASHLTATSRPTVLIKRVGCALERSRKRSWEDDRSNDLKSRPRKTCLIGLSAPRAFTEVDNGYRPENNVLVATAALPGTDTLKVPHTDFTESRFGVPPSLLPLTIKDESPWKTYNKEYTIELGGFVVVAERKNPSHGLVIVKKLSGYNAESKLLRLRQFPEDIQSRYFIRCIEVFDCQNGLHLITEYMTISLLQIVAAPRYPRENHVAAIIGQVLGGIEYLESHGLVHGDITCSNVLLSPEGIVKIANQECCRTASTEDHRLHPDSQALGDVMMQLMEKRNRRCGTISADELHRWSPTIAGFLSDTTSASAQELAQHEFLQNGWRKEDLFSLISFAQIASRRQYKVE